MVNENFKLTQSAEGLAQFIDHTLLKPQTEPHEIQKLCEQAIKYNFFSVCIPPFYAEFAKTIIKNSPVSLCSVVGFPLGYPLTKNKAEETQALRDLGADEFDMVINIGALKSKEQNWVIDDISAVVNKAQGHVVKVIIETCLLSQEEKVLACQWSQKAGAHFVKTSTGFASAGATIEDVQLMKQTVGENMKVKASGGIKSLEQAKQMIEAGAERLGTSSGIQIIDTFKK